MKNQKHLNSVLKMLNGEVESVDVNGKVTVITSGKRVMEIINHDKEDLKLSSDVVTEKQKTIDELSQELSNYKARNRDLSDTLTKNASSVEKDIAISAKVVSLVDSLTVGAFCKNNLLNSESLVELAYLVYSEGNAVNAFGPGFCVVFNHTNNFLYITYDNNPKGTISICIDDLFSDKNKEPENFADLDLGSEKVYGVDQHSIEVSDALDNLLEQYMVGDPMRVLIKYCEDKEAFNGTVIDSDKYKFLVHLGNEEDTISICEHVGYSFEVLGKVSTTNLLPMYRVFDSKQVIVIRG